MKISTEEIKFIQNVIQTANLVGVESVIIEPGKVRGLAASHKVVMQQDTLVHPLQFGSIGLNRLDTLLPRLELSQSRPGFELNVVTAGDDNENGFDRYDPSTSASQPMWARSLKMVASGLSIEFRCASPQTIQAPKKRAGSLRYSSFINADAISILQKSKQAMKSDDVYIKGDSNGISLVVTDVSNDSLEYTLSSEIVLLDEDDTETPDFKYKYQADKLLTVIKSSPTGEFFITARGSMMIKVNGIDIYLMEKD